MDVYGQGVNADGSLGEPTGVQAPAPGVRLAQNHPNPFNPSTTISFRLTEAGPVSLRIYDASGRLQRTLHEEAAMESGEYSVIWDGRDGSGHALPSGVYLYAMEQANFRQSKRMVLMK